MAYFLPDSLDEALDRLGGPAARIVAGGTDLYPAMGACLPEADLVDITRIAECRGVSHGPAGWRIGAATTWSELLAADLPPAFDGLRAAAREVGSVQIQNAATLAGNLCNASPAADGVPPLLTLAAEVEIAGPAGRRRLPLAAFLAGARQTALAPGEMLAAVHVPEPWQTARGAFLKLGSRRYLVISIAMVAVLLRLEAGRIADARVAVGACSAVAQRLPALEAALAGLTAADIEALQIGAAHLAPLDPIDDVRASAAYRREAAAVLCRRAVLQAMGGAA